MSSTSTGSRSAGFRSLGRFRLSRTTGLHPGEDGELPEEGQEESLVRAGVTQSTVSGVQIPYQEVEAPLDLDPLVGAACDPHQLHELVALADVDVRRETAGEGSGPEVKLPGLPTAPLDRGEAGGAGAHAT